MTLLTSPIGCGDEGLRIDELSTPRAYWAHGGLCRSYHVLDRDERRWYDQACENGLRVAREGQAPAGTLAQVITLFAQLPDESATCAVDANTEEHAFVVDRVDGERSRSGICVPPRPTESSPNANVLPEPFRSLAKLLQADESKR